jgi:hypothetical protein
MIMKEEQKQRIKYKLIDAESKRAQTPHVIIVDETNSHSYDESFDLNGVKYAPIKTEQRKHKQVSSKLGGIMAMASMIYMPYADDFYGYGESRYERKLPDGTDIIKEYGLIQNKQSKLSKWERDMVVRIFEKNYYLVL